MKQKILQSNFSFVFFFYFLILIFLFRQRKQWLTLKYVEKRFTKDWVESPKEDSEETKRQLSQQKRLEELRSAAHDIRKRKYFILFFILIV